jgi:hypothetical protein
MKKTMIVAALTALIAGASVPALARTDVSFGVFVGVPGVAYVPPPPVVYAPAPVYYAPPPVYYRPRPYYYGPPAPVHYYHGHHYGWYGHR